MVTTYGTYVPKHTSSAKNDFAQAGGDAIDNLESIYDLVITYLENS